MEDSIITSELNDTEIICPICNAEFLDSEDLNIHMEQHSQLGESKTNHFCNLCFVKFADTEYYALHIIYNHLTTAVSCKYCTRVFFDKIRAKQHEIKHNAAILAPKLCCSQCKNIFHNNDDLEEHEYTKHSDNDGIMLRDCFPMLSSLLNMNIRQFLKVPYQYNFYKCLHCKMGTRDVNKYLKHLEVENSKSLACNKCCDVFLTKQSLVKHMQKKQSCFNFLTTETCDKCKQEIDRIILKEHEKYCKETFVRTLSTTANSILRNANGEDSLPLVNCKFCHRPFISSALNKHIERTHRSTLHLYKYLCTYCDVVFKHPKFLFAHYFSQHRDLQPYTCNICEKTFRIRKNFTYHIKMDHKSVGFVEFAENFHVFFTDKKSENPFQPQVLFTNEYNVSRYTSNSVKSSRKINNNQRHDRAIEVVEINENQYDENNTLYNPDGKDNKRGSTDKHKDIDGVDKDNGIIDEETEEQYKVSNVNSVNLDSVNSDFMETDGYQTEFDNRKTLKNKRKRKVQSKKCKIQRKKRKRDNDTEIFLSSDDSNMALEDIKKQEKCKNAWPLSPDAKLKGRKKKSKFTCILCKKNCYTYQNYHHHMSLHKKSKTKKCIKCSEVFMERAELNEHIKNMHSSSQLTEYLKQMIERRKTTIQYPRDRKSVVEGLRKTIKKVEIEKSNSTATLTQVDDRLSVKNFLENFTPDNEALSKDITIQNSLSIKQSNNQQRPSVIKMAKCRLDNTQTVVKPKMPVKFREELNMEPCKVTISLSQESVPNPNFRLTEPVEHADHTYTDQDNVEDSNDFDDRTSVPDVAEEVMLNTEEIPEKPRGTVIIENLPEIYSKVRIAHLQKEAPFYKIVPIDEVLKPQKLPEEKPPPRKITLPDGTKLVTVNPLAHLLGDKDVSQLWKKKKSYYSKSRDIKVAIAKTLQKRPNKKKQNSDEVIF